MDSHFGGRLFVGVIGQILPEGICQLQFAGLGELEHGGGGEHLIHGADAKAGIQPVGDAMLAVGQSVGAGEDQLVPFGDHHGSGEAVFGGALLDLGL